MIVLKQIWTTCGTHSEIINLDQMESKHHFVKN